MKFYNIPDKKVVDLDYHIEDHVNVGSYHCDKRLGFQKMPEGYALMLNGDMSHFYWLREDGAESSYHWNQWAVYRGAKLDKEKYQNKK